MDLFINHQMSLHFAFPGQTHAGRVGRCHARVVYAQKAPRLDAPRAVARAVPERCRVPCDCAAAAREWQSATGVLVGVGVWVGGWVGGVLKWPTSVTNHSFVFTARNTNRNSAREYHWHCFCSFQENEWVAVSSKRVVVSSTRYAPR